MFEALFRDFRRTFHAFFLFFIVLVGWALLVDHYDAITFWFSPKYELRTYLSKVDGLRAGSPVQLLGLDVGRVREIRSAPRTENEDSQEGSSFEVILDIRRSHQSRIRSDSQASTFTLGLLGDRHVQISPGFNGIPLPAGSEIPAVGECDLSLSNWIEALGNFVSVANCVSQLEKKASALLKKKP